MREETVAEFCLSDLDLGVKKQEFRNYCNLIQTPISQISERFSLQVRCVWGRHPQPLADTFFTCVTGPGPGGSVTQTCKKCWKVKDPGALCFEDVWAGGLRAPWLNISHEPECNPDHSSAAVWLDGGGQGDAGELLPNTRGSSSLGEKEGLGERRGEHSFKALWRLAAVGRAAVFPKSPPNRKTVSFFSVAQEQPLPHSRKRGPALNSEGEKTPQIILLSAWGRLTELCTSLLNTPAADGQAHAPCWISEPTLTQADTFLKHVKDGDSSGQALSPPSVPFPSPSPPPPPPLHPRSSWHAAADWRFKGQRSLCVKVKNH